MKPELLMPAGDMEKMRTAFQYGADAVYAGVPMFSLRARENKFSLQSVKEGVDYAHSLGKKIYLTLNIFPHNYKIPALQGALKQLESIKPDAFIVADPGVIMMCKEFAPSIPIHLSVQANNVNWASAKFWHSQGIERIILSREISLPEIKEIHKNNPGLELEFFVHGSICMAYSGRCLLSNYITYRDANQGTCAHVCRFEYKLHRAVNKYEADEKDIQDLGLIQMDHDYYLEDVTRPGTFFNIDEDEHGTYIMNSRDMCLVEFLKELKDAGVCSFKVEGRNKTAYYVATVAKTYREAIDDMEAGKPFDPKYLSELAATSNRGFIAGFINQNPREKAQEYEKNYSYQTHEFVGIVKGIHEVDGKKMYEIVVKGRMDAPDNIEVLSPEKTFPVKIEYFKKLNADDGQIAETLMTVHPGQRDHVLIELPEDVPVNSMLRKQRAPLDFAAQRESSSLRNDKQKNAKSEAVSAAASSDTGCGSGSCGCK